MSSRARAKANLGGGVLRLAGGLEIACQTVTEARFLYHDIFEKKIYLRHGVSLDDVECVVDVGANIGLFSLFVCEHCPRARVYAFEPAPPVFELLRQNVERFGEQVELFDCGLSDREGTAQFTFYPNSSAMSTFYADESEEKAALYQLMVNEQHEGAAGMDELMKHADDLLDERLRAVTYECRLRPLSAIIREHGIERIDLLKVDVQKSELDVIRGIDDEHWPRIRQVVLELHNTENQYEGLRSTFESYGFHVEAEQEHAYEESEMLNVFATRPHRSVAPRPSLPSTGRRRSPLEQARQRAEKIKAARARLGRGAVR